MTEFKYPWEVAEEKSMLSSDLDTYIDFMDRHVRVRTFKDGVQIGTFSIVSDGTDLGAEISLQNGALYKIVVVGHPNTHDPIMTPEELANYLLTI
jgi:hypothetical protein